MGSGLSQVNVRVCRCKRLGIGKMALIATSATTPLLLPSSTSGANSYWDTTPGVAGGGVTPTGVWDQSTSLNWTPDVNGAAADNVGWSTVATDASNFAIFAAGADAVAPYTITIEGTITGIGRIVLEKDGIPNQTSQTGFDTTFAAGSNNPTLDFGANPIDFELTIANSARRDLNINNGILLRTTHPTSGLIKRSSGTLQLRGSISYNGITDGSSTATFDIFNGIANVNSLNLITKTLRFGNGNSNTQLGTLVFTGGTFVLDSSYNLVFNGGSIGLENNDSGAGRTLTIAAPVTLPVFASNPNKDFQVGGTSTNLNIVSGLISQSAGAGTLTLIKVDAGRWRIANDSNSFTGNIDARNGDLEFTSIANSGSPSALGQGTTLILGSSTSVNGPVLRYMGSADASTDRTIHFRGGGAGTGNSTLANNGTGSIRYTGAFLNDSTDNASPASGRALILTGSNTLNNEITAPLIDSTATPAAPATANFLNVTKNGAGKWILSGTSTYSGTTVINDGMLLINGSLSPSSSAAVSVNAASPAAGVLGGTGLIARPVTINSGGTIAPGSTTGTLDIAGPLTLGPGSIYAVEIGGITAGDGIGFHDQLNMSDPTGSVSLDNTAVLSVSLAGGFDPATAGSSVLFILNRADTGSYTTSFAGAPEGSLITFAGGRANITYAANATGGTLTGGNDIALFNVAVPEPGPIGLLAAVGTGLLARRRRQRCPHRAAAGLL